MPEHHKDSKQWSGGLADDDPTPKNSFYNQNLPPRDSRGNRPAPNSSNTQSVQHPSRFQVPPQPNSNTQSVQHPSRFQVPPQPNSKSPAAQLEAIPSSVAPSAQAHASSASTKKAETNKPKLKVPFLKSAMKSTSTVASPGYYPAAFPPSHPQFAQKPAPKKPAPSSNSESTSTSTYKYNILTAKPKPKAAGSRSRSPSSSQPRRRPTSILPNWRENDSDSDSPKGKEQAVWKHERIHDECVQELLLSGTSLSLATNHPLPSSPPPNSQPFIHQIESLDPGPLYDTVVHASSLGAISSPEYLDLLDFFYRFLPQVLVAPKTDPVITTASQLRRHEKILDMWGPGGLSLSDVRGRAARLMERGDNGGTQVWYSRPRPRATGLRFPSRERSGSTSKERSKERKEKDKKKRKRELARKILSTSLT